MYTAPSQVGAEVEVKCIGVDPLSGAVKLSRRALLDGADRPLDPHAHTAVFAALRPRQGGGAGRQGQGGGGGEPQGGGQSGKRQGGKHEGRQGGNQSAKRDAKKGGKRDGGKKEAARSPLSRLRKNGNTHPPLPADIGGAVAGKRAALTGVASGSSGGDRGSTVVELSGSAPREPSEVAVSEQGSAEHPTSSDSASEEPNLGESGVDSANASKEASAEEAETPTTTPPVFVK